MNLNSWVKLSALSRLTGQPTSVIASWRKKGRIKVFRVGDQHMLEARSLIGLPIVKHLTEVDVAGLECPDANEDWVGSEEAGVIAGCCAATIVHHFRAGLIRGIEVGRKLYFRRSDIEELSIRKWNKKEPDEPTNNVPA